MLIIPVVGRGLIESFSFRSWFGYSAVPLSSGGGNLPLFSLFLWHITICCYFRIDPLSFCPNASWPNVTDLSSDFYELLRLRTLLLDNRANEENLLDLLLALSWDIIIFYPDIAPMLLLQWSEFSPEIELFYSLSLLHKSQHLGDFSKRELEFCACIIISPLDEDFCLIFGIEADAAFVKFLYGRKSTATNALVDDGVLAWLAAASKFSSFEEAEWEGILSESKLLLLREPAEERRG